MALSLSFAQYHSTTFQMLNLSDADIEKFQALVLKETGKKITKEEARERAMNLIELVGFVMRGKPSPSGSSPDSPSKKR